MYLNCRNSAVLVLSNVFWQMLEHLFKQLEETILIGRVGGVNAGIILVQYMKKNAIIKNTSWKLRLIYFFKCRIRKYTCLFSISVWEKTPLINSMVCAKSINSCWVAFLERMDSWGEPEVFMLKVSHSK